MAGIVTFRNEVKEHPPQRREGRKVKKNIIEILLCALCAFAASLKLF
jgi:hypothetical protein